MPQTSGVQDKHETMLIQHLGIVAGICRNSRLAELIDQRVDQPKRHVTVGQATVAMILNALGLSGRAVYLTKLFRQSTGRSADRAAHQGGGSARLLSRDSPGRDL